VDGSDGKTAPESQGEGQETPPRRDSATFTIAAGLLILALSWYLLKELATLLRPLLLAVFLGYVILPVHLQLSKRIPKIASVAVLAGGTLGLLFLLGWLIQSSVAGLDEDLPRLTRRAETIYHQVREFFEENVPWLVSPTLDEARAKEQRSKKIHEIVKDLVNVAAGALVNTVVVGFYLLFLLLEAGRFPQRVQKAFAGTRAEQIMAVAGNINRAIAGYLHVKVKASLLLAIPVVLVLWIFDVKFAALWGVLTFLFNFIPYIGSILAVSLPIGFAFLQAETDWQPIAAGLGVVTIHVVMTYLVEPTMVGKGVGLSPLVILIALAFWGLCWGLVGMFLAIPLTVVLKIILENVDTTRPLALLLADK
jgi:AI-2 transport protein TqsA